MSNENILEKYEPEPEIKETGNIETNSVFLSDIKTFIGLKKVAQNCK